MLTRLYVDNYKCLVNFDLRLGREHLFLGRNGSGKSTVFEVLAALRRLLVEDARADEVFGPLTLTRWQSRDVQTFRLEVDLAGTIFQYELVVRHELTLGRTRIESEKLSAETLEVFSSKHGQAQIFSVSSGAPVDVNRSALSLLVDVLGLEPVVPFRQWLRRVHVVRADPRRMKGRSEGDAPTPSEDLSNFASWYRHLTQERLNEVVQTRDSLRQILEGFDSLVLKTGGEQVRILRSLWRREGGKTGSGTTDEYAIEELSDGQRALIGLYTLLHAFTETGATLCLDEPDNFVALREIQPFLQELRERERVQSLLISHHPEVINLLAPKAGLQFERVAGGPVRVNPFQALADNKAGLTPAELVARGWEDGQ